MQDIVGCWIFNMLNIHLKVDRFILLYILFITISIYYFNLQFLSFVVNKGYDNLIQSPKKEIHSYKIIINKENSLIYK